MLYCLRSLMDKIQLNSSALNRCHLHCVCKIQAETGIIYQTQGVVSSFVFFLNFFFLSDLTSTHLYYCVSHYNVWMTHTDVFWHTHAFTHSTNCLILKGMFASSFLWKDSFSILALTCGTCWCSSVSHDIYFW